MREDHLTNAYSNMYHKQKQVVTESSDETFGKAGSETKEPKTLKDNGPANAEGFEESALDSKNKECNCKPGECNCDDHYSTKKHSQPQKKVKEESLNNSKAMKNESSFDNLFNQVMNEENPDELAALGIDSGDDVEAGDEFGGDDMGDDMEGEGDVTITLTSDQVSVLRDILSQLDGDGEEDFGDEEDFDGEDDMGGEYDDEFGGEDDSYGEGVDAEYRGHPLVNQKKSELDNSSGTSSNKASGNVRKSGGSARSDAATKVGQGETKGHPLVNQKKSELDNSSGTSSNKASGNIRGKNQDLLR